MGLEEGTEMLDYRQLGDMFDDHDHVCVLYNRVFSNSNTISRNISPDDEVVVILHNSDVYESVIPEMMRSHGKRYELRFIACTVDMDGTFKWDGKIYCRHGKENHQSWWVQNRNNCILCILSMVTATILISVMWMSVFMWWKRHQIWKS